MQGRTYQILKTIGEGAYSTVLLCQLVSGYVTGPGAPPSGSYVAVKRTTVSSERLHAVHDEMALLDQLEGHPHIVRHYGCEVATVKGATTVVTAMEYCPGRLVDRMAEAQRTGGGALPLAEIVTAFASVASAIQFMHSQSPPVAHRDIKPENVLISERGVFKLCDFGSATKVAFHCLSRQDASLAMEDIERNTTLLYRAPEMVDPWRKQRIDEKTDVWALGVLLYYMLFFHFPFEETSLSILNGKYTLPETFAGGGRHVPEPLLEIIRRCLTPNPSHRWSVFGLVAYLGAAATSLPFKRDLLDVAAALAPLKAGGVQDVHHASKVDFPADEPPQPSPGSGLVGAGGGGGGGLFSMLHWTAPPPSSGATVQRRPSAANAEAAVAAADALASPSSVPVSSAASTPRSGHSQQQPSRPPALYGSNPRTPPLSHNSSSTSLTTAVAVGPPLPITSTAPPFARPPPAPVVVGHNPTVSLVPLAAAAPNASLDLFASLWGNATIPASHGRASPPAAAAVATTVGSGAPQPSPHVTPVVCQQGQPQRPQQPQAADDLFAFDSSNQQPRPSAALDDILAGFSAGGRGLGT